MRSACAAVLICEVADAADVAAVQAAVLEGARCADNLDVEVGRKGESLCRVHAHLLVPAGVMGTVKQIRCGRLRGAREWRKAVVVRLSVF